MRRDAAATARAVGEQVAATEQIAKAADSLSRQAAQLSRAMVEQRASANQISTAADSMRQQAEQAARALAEQSRTMKDVAAGSANTAKQIKLIQRANREQSAAANDLVQQMGEIRIITERNVAGVHEARGSAEEMVGQATALRSAVTRARKAPRPRADGR